MSNFIVAVGHTASGNVGCGIVDKLDESQYTREIGALVAEHLNEFLGYIAGLLIVNNFAWYLVSKAC